MSDNLLAINIQDGSINILASNFQWGHIKNTFTEVDLTLIIIIIEHSYSYYMKYRNNITHHEVNLTTKDFS